MTPQELSDLDIMFPTGVSHLMPPMEEIPEDFKRRNNPYVKIVRKWFYEGIEKSTLRARDGIDQRTAARHLAAVLQSFEPAHEHKMAAVAYLMSQWFEISEAVR